MLISTASRMAAMPGANLGHEAAIGAADRGDDAELQSRRWPRSAAPPGPARGCPAAWPGRWCRKRPDWAQKWQSSGQRAGLERDNALDLDLGAAPTQADVVGQLERCGQASVGKRSTSSTCAWSRPWPRSRTRSAARPRMSEVIPLAREFWSLDMAMCTIDAGRTRSSTGVRLRTRFAAAVHFSATEAKPGPVPACGRPCKSRTPGPLLS